MRLGFALVMAAAMMALPYFAYTYGVPADGNFSKSYVQTVNSVRYHVTTYSASDSIQYEKAEILNALGAGSHVVGRFIATIPQRIHN